ncbi:MAG: hypothetical protein JNL50_02120 [Phycisphaerae bacterium]|nr:hypothetical protein [Phycisphaerae bacterium]
MFLRVIGPATGGLGAPVDSSAWSAADHERFAGALYLWTALAFAAAVSVAVLLAYCLHLVRSHAGSVGRRWVLSMLVVAFGVVCYFTDAGASSSELSFHEQGLVGIPLASLTKPLNALVGAAVAGLFAAGAALSVGVSVERTPAAGARGAEALRVLILVGAAATVLGMLSIGALHRLPGAGVTGSKVDEGVRSAAWAHVRTLLDSQATGGEKHAGLPIVARWIAARAGVPEGEASALAPGALASARDSADFKSWVLAARDESARAARARALDGVATAIASWWGVVFATTLTVVYVLGVWAIAPVAELRGTSALSLARQGEKGGLFAVLVRVLTALAPLLTAGLAEAIRKVLELLQPGAS